MLEIETLSPIRDLAPGAAGSHTEKWYLLGEIPQPHSLKERELSEWIEPLLARVGLGTPVAVS